MAASKGIKKAVKNLLLPTSRSAVKAARRTSVSTSQGRIQGADWGDSPP